MSGPAPGTHLHGLVLVDTRGAAVSASGACHGLLLSRGHQGLLSGRPGRADPVPEEHRQRHKRRVEQRDGEGGHRQRANEILQIDPSVADKAPADRF